MTAIKAIDKDGEISALLLKASGGHLEGKDVGQLVQWTRRWLVLKALLETGSTTFKDLKTLLLGLNLETEEPEDKVLAEGEPADHDELEWDEEEEEPGKKKGHGRRGASGYKGCHQVEVFPERVQPGNECPECVGGRKGRLRFHKPGRPLKRLRLTGGAPITGTVYVGYPLCCSKCGAQFTPDWPEDANHPTYDASAKAMIVLMRHWYGFPSYRLAKLQEELGIPVPDGTQADLIRACARGLEPVFHALFRLGAQAKQVLVDDTSARIQTVTNEHRKYPDQKRYGAHVTGIIARAEDRDIYIYRVGTQHAGENLEDLLVHRPVALPPPLQMNDALGVNTCHPFETIVANCLNHARSNFVEIEDSFPVECRTVLRIFSKVFKHEAKTKERNLSEEERLLYHQQHSAKPMAKLFTYLKRLLDDKLVEPSSGMGKAANYMLKRKAELTRFLHIPGAPLDSNAIERGLKCAVLIRKNSLHYFNEITAYNASVLMTLIATAVHHQVDPLHYLTVLLQNEDDLKANPEAWLPWTYRDRPSSRDG